MSTKVFKQITLLLVLGSSFIFYGCNEEVEKKDVIVEDTSEYDTLSKSREELTAENDQLISDNAKLSYQLGKIDTRLIDLTLKMQNQNSKIDHYSTEADKIDAQAEMDRVLRKRIEIAKSIRNTTEFEDALERKSNDENVASSAPVLVIATPKKKLSDEAYKELSTYMQKMNAKNAKADDQFLPGHHSSYKVIAGVGSKKKVVHALMRVTSEDLEAFKEDSKFRYSIIPADKLVSQIYVKVIAQDGETVINLEKFGGYKGQKVLVGEDLYPVSAHTDELNRISMFSTRLNAFGRNTYLPCVSGGYFSTKECFAAIKNHPFFDTVIRNNRNTYRDILINVLSSIDQSINSSNKDADNFFNSENLDEIPAQIVFGARIAVRQDVAADESLVKQVKKFQTGYFNDRLNFGNGVPVSQFIYQNSSDHTNYYFLASYGSERGLSNNEIGRTKKIPVNQILDLRRYFNELANALRI